MISKTVIFKNSNLVLKYPFSLHYKKMRKNNKNITLRKISIFKKSNKNHGNSLYKAQKFNKT